MHLLVLSAFRQGGELTLPGLLGVSMHLLVLSAFRPKSFRRALGGTMSLNAPFGAQCFPTLRRRRCRRAVAGLNAPFGAQCFPTCRAREPPADRTARLNAPFGAQCFPTLGQSRRRAAGSRVSMHLLVLSAFRQGVGSSRG